MVRILFPLLPCDSSRHAPARTREVAYDHTLSRLEEWLDGRVLTAALLSETVKYPLDGGSGKAARSIISLADQASGLQADSVATRTGTSLTRAYPNPFNPVTTISFTLADTIPVRLRVFDVPGRSVAALVNSEMSAGEHSVAFDASHLPSGLYIIRMEAPRQHWTQWVSLVK